MTDIKPGLFGIKKSNRNFAGKEDWGKNKFNSSFPVSLASYLHSKGLKNIYLELNKKLEVFHNTINGESLFGIAPDSEQLFFAFESPYTKYEQLLIGNIPRDDVVTHNTESKNCLKALEIKLTALPDNSTCDLKEDQYGCELVIRPDTIVYLACSIAILFADNGEKEKLKDIFGNEFEQIKDWTQPSSVLSYIPVMAKKLDIIFSEKIDCQEPLLLQPVWKTLGKSPQLADNCLDVFVWSNFAFARLFIDAAKELNSKITRQLRSIAWLFKMLYDFSMTGQMNHRQIIDELSFNTKNDKAFSVSGKTTHPYMKCDCLVNPRIQKSEIKEIIPGGGQNMLSPERRFDAIIYNSPSLFE